MEIMNLLMVLGLGVIELWGAIPAGLALRLPPPIVGVTAATGAMLGALIVVLLGKRARSWLTRHRGGRQEAPGRHRLIHQVWRRYGVIGLGLLSPLLTGAPLGVVLGLALGAPAGRLLFWTSLGIIFWSTALTLAGALGLAGIKALGHTP